MRYPINISKRIREAGKVTVPQKVGAVVSVLIVVNLILFVQITGVYGGFGLPSTLILFIQLIISAVIMVTVFRLWIIREDDKLAEHQRSKDSSLSNYFYIRDKENQDTLEGAPVFEYTDGNFCILLRLNYGATTDKLAKNTGEYITMIKQETLKLGIELREIDMPEDFRESIECKRYISSLTNIQDPSIKRTMIEIANNMLEMGSKYNQLYSTVILLRTKNPYQIENMASLIRKIVSEYNATKTSLRSLEFLNKQQMRSFMRDYYCLEALDLASLKVADVTKDSLIIYKDKVKLQRVETKEGKVEEIYKINLSTGGKRLV